MLVLALACTTTAPTLVGFTVDRPTWDTPADALVFEEGATLDIEASPWLGADVDGDGDEDLVGLDQDHRVVIWSSDEGELQPAEAFTAPLKQALDADEAWVRQLDVANLGGSPAADILLTVNTRRGEVYEQEVVRLGPDGSVWTVAAAANVAFNAVADLDGDGLSELLLYTADGSWIEFSTGPTAELPADMAWAWAPHAVTLDADGEGGLDILIMNDGGYGIYQGWILHGQGTDFSHTTVLESIYGQDLATDGDAFQPATEAVLTTWGQNLRLVDGAFTDLGLGDIQPLLGGELDGFVGADLLGWNEGALGLVSTDVDLAEVPVSGLNDQTWSAILLDLDGDGLDDLVDPRWTEEGGQTLTVFANITREP